uniref:Uncharacterized protein n=1 Tax=Rhizophora mucronata TaxID=61149 RepID=A0A2P2NMC1_RHIMU
MSRQVSLMCIFSKVSICTAQSACSVALPFYRCV